MPFKFYDFDLKSLLSLSYKSGTYQFCSAFIYFAILGGLDVPEYIAVQAILGSSPYVKKMSFPAHRLFDYLHMIKDR